MDINNYIAPDILERYVLGQATAQEEQLMSCLIKIYPEIVEEREQIERVIQKLADAGAVQPNAKVKEAIMKKVAQTKQEEVESAEKAPKVISMYSTWAVAASVAILMACFFGYRYFTAANQYQDTVAQVAVLEQEQAEREEAMAKTTAKLAFVMNASTQKIVLNGTDFRPEAKATVFWNTENKQVVLDNSSLAELEPDQQYQLWRLVDGVPIDMGVFDAADESMLEMKQAIAADAFAITIEPKGGSESPTLEKMVVVGAVSS